MAADTTLTTANAAVQAAPTAKRMSFFAMRSRRKGLAMKVSTSFSKADFILSGSLALMSTMMLFLQRASRNWNVSCYCAGCCRRACPRLIGS